jgi:hypothetical protein
MRSIWFGLSALALIGCGERPQGEASSDAVAVSDVAESSAPGIAVTAAPGVAFNYRYAFSLPPTAIARTQEAHAAACEKLGVARCRITGMRYRLSGENDIDASLAFKLDPAIARLFGRNGVDLVQAAKGALVDAEITGIDAGAAIGQLTGQRARAADEQRRIAAELARPGLPAAERAELQNQRAELARRIEAATAGAAEQRDSLATTPMTFGYESGPAVRGFDASAPLASALDTAAGSIQVTLAVLLGALALLGPPALALELVWLLWRRFGRRWRDRIGNVDAAAAPSG